MTLTPTDNLTYSERPEAGPAWSRERPGGRSLPLPGVRNA
jgi:hypothetical protein